MRAWAEITLTTVLFVEQQRAQHLADRRLSEEKRKWWKTCGDHGAVSAMCVSHTRTSDFLPGELLLTSISC